MGVIAIAFDGGNKSGSNDTVTYLSVAKCTQYYYWCT